MLVSRDRGGSAVDPENPGVSYGGQRGVPHWDLGGCYGHFPHAIQRILDTPSGEGMSSTLH